MRELLVEVLADAGYDVIAARSGRELFASVEATRGDVAVVVTDLRMPAYDGLEVAEAWAHDRSRPPMILMSAFPDAAARARAAAIGVPLLQKPFDLSVLEELVRRLAARAR